jgi:anti-sigma B factor antagonist
MAWPRSQSYVSRYATTRFSVPQLAPAPEWHNHAAGLAISTRRVMMWMRASRAGPTLVGCSVEVLEFSSDRRGDSVVIIVSGELDIVSSPLLDEAVTQARKESSRVILDMSGVDFMDTSALAVIVGHWKKIEAAGGVLALAGPRYRYTKTLWITGLASRLTLYKTVDEAVAAGEATSAADMRSA